MNKKNARLFLITTMLFIMSSVSAFAAETDIATVNAEKFGVLTILPPLVAIVLAFVTKNVIVSLVLGVMSGGFLLNLNGMNVFSALFSSFLDLVDRAIAALADPWNAGIILQVLAIGGVINLVAKMGGAKAIAEALAKKAKNARSAHLITWASGLLVFFDDYANSLIIGPMMRPVTDKMKISRERLAFVIELNVHAEFSGRNDLLIDGQKFSGNAQYNYKNKVMHHGTLLFSSEINDLSNALKVKPSKFQGKSVKSVKSRVTNISSHLDKEMTVLEFKDYLMNFINKRDENSHFYELNDKDVESINKLVEEKYSTWEWNFGYSPKYSLYNEVKYPGGNLEFSLYVHDGLIKDIKFFGDFFGKEDISFIENKLRNVKHNEYSIKSALEDVDINNYFLNCNIDILVSGIMGAK